LEFEDHETITKDPSGIEVKLVGLCIGCCEGLSVKPLLNDGEGRWELEVVDGISLGLSFDEQTVESSIQH
jgi:hypothetical protein